MEPKQLIELLGGQSSIAQELGTVQSNISYWVSTGNIPERWHLKLISMAGERGIVLSPSDLTKNIKTQPNALKGNVRKDLVVRKSRKPNTPIVDPAQGHIELSVNAQKEIDGIGMGVLSDGTAFLTGSGLARLAGVAPSVISDIRDEYESGGNSPRVAKIREIMTSHQMVLQAICIPITQRSGRFLAYSDSVCIAILEYYAFEVATPRPEAIKNYRLLAGKALRDFIYNQVGYDPNANVPDEWKKFHDRLSLVYNKVPRGYFSIFKEMADMIVTLGTAGIHIDEKFIPDISVGLRWGAFWSDQQFDGFYGERIKYDHNYPSYFPQAISNPQPAWCYPERALAEFRQWFREVYMRDHFTEYLTSQVKQGKLPASFAQLAIAEYTRD